MKTLAKFVENRKCCRSPLLLWSRIMFLLLSKDFEAILKGSSFCIFGGVLYKTKTLAKFVENHKYCRSPLLLQARIMFDLFSRDFKTMLKGFSFLGLLSSVFVLYPPERLALSQSDWSQTSCRGMEIPCMLVFSCSSKAKISCLK